MMSRIPAYMTALQLTGINELVPARLALPVPRADELLIRTTATTICTSDLHDIAGNPFNIRFPRVLGHEGAGIVVSCGEQVTGFTAGDRVAVHPVVPCEHCAECLRGFGHLCLNMGHLGYDRDGSFAEYFVQRADRVRLLPDAVPDELGALLEPVAVCLQAIARAGDITGKTVLIAGDGPFGNIIARLATRAGAARVLVSGKEPFRLSRIPAVEIADPLPLRSVDVAILAVNAPAALEACLQALRPRGRLVIFSALPQAVPVNFFPVHLTELEVVGCCNDENRLDESMACLADPALALQDIITHKMPFSDWQQAFTLARDRHDIALKVALIFNHST